MRIDELSAGDEVLAADPRAGEQRGERVEAVHEHQDALLVLVIGGAQVRTTEDHPFWAVSDQRYERADHLSPGEQVLTAGGRTATVEAIIDDQPVLAPAYTLTVCDLHTYFVRTNTPPTTDPARGPPTATGAAILVHNCDEAADAAGEALLLERANALRDGKVAELAAGSARGRAENAVVVGAFNARTGNVASGV